MTRLLNLIPRTNDFLPSRDLFDRFFDDWRMPALFSEESTWVPAFDISETDKEYVITAELPGIEIKDVDITLRPTDPQPPPETENGTEETHIEENGSETTTTIETDTTIETSAFEKNNYYLQIGAYKTRETAERVARAFSAYPIRIITASTSSGTIYRVVVGPLNQDESGTVLTVFKAKGYKDAFIKYVD